MIVFNAYNTYIYTYAGMYIGNCYISREVDLARDIRGGMDGMARIKSVFPLLLFLNRRATLFSLFLLGGDVLVVSALLLAAEANIFRILSNKLDAIVERLCILNAKLIIEWRDLLHSAYIKKIDFDLQENEWLRLHF